MLRLGCPGGTGPVIFGRRGGRQRAVRSIRELWPITSCRLRQIPSINVVVLDEVPNSEVITVEDFREKILQPLLAGVAAAEVARPHPVHGLLGRFPHGDRHLRAT